MGKRIALSVLIVGMLVLGIVGSCLAGIEPSPFQPEINKLHSIELNVAAINKRLVTLHESGTLTEGTTNYLQAMANQMTGLKTRLEEVLDVLTPSLASPFIGRDEAVFALESIGGDSKEVYNNVRDIATSWGIGPSPFRELLFDDVSTIITRINIPIISLDRPALEIPSFEPQIPQ
jgi:hypothetical protein